jgi:hypothetical protein
MSMITSAALSAFGDKVVLALLIGISTNAIFLLLLSVIRPKVAISRKIAKGKSRTGRDIYRIKIINKTQHPIVDIKAQLHLLTNYQTHNGDIFKAKQLKLVQSEPLTISGFNKRDRDADYAYRFVTYEDLGEVWSDDTAGFLRLRIFSRHSITGFGSVVQQDFRVKRVSIMEGDFAKGNSFAIL